MYINKAIIFGNLTRDPELRAMPSGMNVVNFSVATNRVFKDRDGKKQEQTDFHNVVVFGRQADIVNQYLRKGSSVYVEGRMQTRSWDDKASGTKKFRTEIVADQIQFGPKGSGAGAGTGSNRAAGPEDQAHDYGPQDAGIDYPKDDINPDDIPF